MNIRNSSDQTWRTVKNMTGTMLGMINIVSDTTNIMSVMTSKGIERNGTEYNVIE